MADEDRGVGPNKPGNNIYTIMLLVTMAAYIAGIVVLVLDMQKTRKYNYQLLGEGNYQTVKTPAPTIEIPED